MRLVLGLLLDDRRCSSRRGSRSVVDRRVLGLALDVRARPPFPAPFETVTSTSGPSSPRCRRRASCAITWPSGRSESSSSTLGSNPASSICASASASCRPEHVGNGRRASRPSRSRMVTTDSHSTFSPASGSVSTTFPALTPFESTSSELRPGGSRPEASWSPRPRARRSRPSSGSPPQAERDADLDLGALVRTRRPRAGRSRRRCPARRSSRSRRRRPRTPRPRARPSRPGGPCRSPTAPGPAPSRVSAKTTPAMIRSARTASAIRFQRLSFVVLLGQGIDCAA